MADFEREDYLRKIKAEAWDAYRLSLGRTQTQAFSVAVHPFERELRVLLAANEASDRDYADEMRAISTARDIAHEVLDELDPDRPMAARLHSLVVELDKVLGPDLVREADPTGKVLKSLPYDERKAMLDAIPDGPLEVGSPEHDAFCMGQTAKMAAEDVARGEDQ
jgi:hypothetical protein